MSKKKIALIVLILLGVLANVCIIKYGNRPIKEEVNLYFDMSADEEQMLQVYYGTDTKWKEEKSSIWNYAASDWTEGYVTIPTDAMYLRFDFGHAESKVELKNIHLEEKEQIKQLDLVDAENMVKEEHSIGALDIENGHIKVETVDEDPYFVVNISDWDIEGFLVEADRGFNKIYKLVLCVVLDIILLVFCIFHNKLFSLPKELFQNRKLIAKLAKNDFKTKYAGSYLGIFWAFVQPVVTVLVYWFVFQVGFRSGSTQDVPFVLWLVCGLVPWFFFQEALIGGTNSMMEYSYLVKKVVFKISVLPIVKITSAIFVHLFFIGFTIVLFLCYGYLPSIHVFQIIYYLICMFVFVLALSYITCAVVVFFKDLSQIINIIMQVGVWMTPIMWDYNMITGSYPGAMWILKANPMFYIVQGYRNCLINKVWFWEDLGWTIYFWAITGVLFVIGAMVFKRLKPHFSDVL